MRQIKTFTLAELAHATGSRLVGNPDFPITGYAEIENAGEQDVSFLSNPRYTSTRYATAMKQSRAGAVFVSPAIQIESGRNYLVHEDPSDAFQRAVEKMLGGPPKRSYFPGAHPQAVIHESASIGDNVSIGPNAVIDGHTVIGDNTFIGAGAYIGPHNEIGEDCVIHPNAVIRENCRLGSRVVVQPGTVIGSCGFGYSTDAKGTHTRIKQLGQVIIEDDVEIGSNCIIDRARFTETRIGQGTKIDSLVIIGHNCKVGNHNLICGHTALAGSTRTGNHVVIAGQCGIDGHLTISDGVIITAKSGVTKSLPPGRYGGFPAVPLDEFNKKNVHHRKIDQYAAIIKDLQSRLEKLEQQ